MEFKAQLIMNILRVLTPEEINELTTTYGGRKQISLTDIVNCELEGKNYEEELIEDEENEEEDVEHEAKILPFEASDKSEESEEEDVPLTKCGENTIGILQQFYARIMEMEKNLLGPKRLPKRKSAGLKKEMSTFILEEKKKFEDSYEKLKSKEVLSLYKKNAKMDIEHQRNCRDDLSKSSQSGVLVNKKQA